MGTNVLPRKKRHKMSVRLRVLLSLLFAALLVVAVPTSVAMASEDGSDSTTTSQTVTSEESTTTATSTPTTAADPPDSSGVDQQEGGEPDDSNSVGSGQEDSGSDKSIADPGDSEQGQGDDQSPGSDDPPHPSNSPDQFVVAQQESDTSTSQATIADLVPVTITYGQSGSCPNFTVSGMLSGDIPDDMTLDLSVKYGIPGDGFPTGDTASFGPGLVAGQSYSISFSTATIPSGADPGYGWFVDASSNNQSALLTSYAVDTSSCDHVPPVDSDGDGVSDDQDQCPGTPAGTTVDEHGCPVVIPPTDSDNDGVPDDKDKCANTPANSTVDSDGCADSQKDSDGDGKTDDVDKCANTPAGSSVDANGCADSQKDSDGDGVTDDKDKCPGTASGFTVDGNGCIVCPEGTQPVYAEGNDGIVNDCRPVVTTPPTTPTTTSSGPTSTAQPTSSSNPPSSSASQTTSSGLTSSPQPTSNNGGQTTNQPTSSNAGPVVIDVPATPAVNDPPGSGNATWIKPAGDGPIVWTLSDGDRHIVATLPAGHVFANGQLSIDFGIACDSEGEQAAPLASNAGNPTPQPTGNGGMGVRASSSGGELIRAVGVIGLALVGGVVLVLLARRRSAGQHQ